MKRIITIITVLITLLGCTKTSENYSKRVVNGVTVVKNKNIVSDANFRINLNKIFEFQSDTNDSLKNFSAVTDLDIDKDGNIFLLDKELCRILKFDNTGNFVKSFGRKGSGPGEFTNAFTFTIMNDTILLPEVNMSKIIKFDLDGNFLLDDKIKNCPLVMDKAGDNFIDRGTKGSGNNEKMSIERYSFIIDKNYNKLDTLYHFKKTYTIAEMKNISMDDTPKLAMRDEIYLAENSTDTYMYKVFSTSGKLLKKVYKSYIKTKQNETTLEKRKKSAIFTMDGEKKELKQEDRYINAINEIKIDMYNRVYIKSYTRNDEGKNLYDVFSNDGVYLNRIEMPETEFTFIKDKLVTIDREKFKIEFYSY